METADRAELTQALRDLTLSLLRDAPRHELSRSAAGTLSVLDRLGPQRITALAEREAVSQPSMTGLVQRLEAIGYVIRSADPEDGRASLVAITPEGVAALQARRRLHDEAIDARLARLSTDDLQVLVAALPAIRQLITTETHVTR
ncbi:MAG TPA: MarR family transcriptional regulator [Marmoricola sp.]|nr:MarR family transcriptional regulator [Marmoricola sp.]